MKYLNNLIDFIKSIKPVYKKNKSEIVSSTRWRAGRWYVYDTKLSRIERTNPIYYLNGRNNLVSMSSEMTVRDISNLLIWKRANQDKILLNNLGISSESNIDPKIFLKDITNICEKKQLDIIAIEFNDRYSSSNESIIQATIFVREHEFKDSDGMPTDIIEYYVSYLKSEFKTLRQQYYTEYDLLKSSRLYLNKDAKITKVHGLIEFKIDIGI